MNEKRESLASYLVRISAFTLGNAAYDEEIIDDDDDDRTESSLDFSINSVHNAPCHA